MTKQTFKTWDEVLDAAKDDDLSYQAPLDRYPVAVRVLKIFKNRKLRLCAFGCYFTADEGHLDRFSRMVSNV